MASAASEMVALRSLDLAWAGDVVKVALEPRERAEEVLTVGQGRLGRAVHPSDSEVDNSDPEPDFPS